MTSMPRSVDEGTLVSSFLCPQWPFKFGFHCCAGGVQKKAVPKKAPNQNETQMPIVM